MFFILVWRSSHCKMSVHLRNNFKVFHNQYLGTSRYLKWLYFPSITLDFSVQIVICCFGLRSYLTVCLYCKDQQWRSFIVTFNKWNTISTFETFLVSSLQSRVLFYVLFGVDNALFYVFFVCKPEEKRPLGRPRRRWEDNIKMDLQEVGGSCGDWMELAQDRERWRALVGMVRNLRVPKMRGISWLAAEPVSFSRRTLLHGVSK